jgi:hypothetical protein
VNPLPIGIGSGVHFGCSVLSVLNDQCLIIYRGVNSISEIPSSLLESTSTSTKCDRRWIQEERWVDMIVICEWQGREGDGGYLSLSDDGLAVVEAMIKIFIDLSKDSLQVV